MKVPVTRNREKASTRDAMLLRKFLTIAFAFLVAFFCSNSIYAQSNIRVKGRVTSDNGTPVPSATVSVKGTTRSTISDAGGNFEIDAPSNGTLVFSSAGYETGELKINGQASLAISLKTNVLEQVVVIGYGTQKKRDVTGSTVSVKGETLREIGAPNFFNQLQGRAAGVDIVTNGSSIGTGGEIRIRGNRSLASGATANQMVANNNAQNGPLIVVDGIALAGGSINDINSSDIATIDILKDASATAIYGSRGSGGVIIITTRRGRTGKAVTSYDGYVGVTQAIDTYRIFNGTEYAKFKQDAKDGQPTPTNPHPNALTAIETTNLAAGVSTDWQDLLLTKGLRTDHNVNISGGNEFTQYSFGAGFFRETGIIHDQSFDRGSFRVAIDHKLSNRIKVGFTSTNTMSWGNRTGTNAYGAGERLSPLYKPYNDDGTINMLPATQQANDATQINPLTSIGNNDKIKALNRRFRTLSTFYTEIDIIKNLKFKAYLGLDWIQTLQSNYTGPNTVFNANTTTAGANLSQTNDETWSYTVDNTLTYDKTFDKHRIQATALYEVVKNASRNQGYNGQGVPADYIQDYNFQLVNTVTANAGSFGERGLVSYMGRVFYSYDDRYMITGTIRRDGASVLAPGHQYVTYPAVSVGWNISNEKFMQSTPFVSSLKLRAGWGISSNQTIAPYQTLGSLNSNFYNFGAGTTANVNYVNGYVINTLANPALTWEKTAGYNIGVDFGFLGNRITGAIEYYNVETSDILLQKLLPPSNGANSVLVNAGKTAGHGMEFSVSSLNIKPSRQDGFSWSTDANLFFSREKIVALQNNLPQDIGNGWYVGQPLTVIYDVKKIGIWQTSEAAAAVPYGAFPGDIKIEDVNKNNAIGPEDRQMIGNFQPDFVAGLTNRFTYKNFDLSVTMFGRFGQSVVVTYLSADGGANGYPFFLNSRVNQFKVDYWTATNPTNEFPQPDASKDATTYNSTLTYRDGSFIKIRTIDFGYNFSPTIARKAGLNSLRVYFSAQNPFIVWAPLVRDGLGIDPEGNGNGANVGSTAGGTPVVARSITVNMGVPPTRQFIFGVNLKF